MRTSYFGIVFGVDIGGSSFRVSLYETNEHGLPYLTPFLTHNTPLGKTHQPEDIGKRIRTTINDLMQQYTTTHTSSMPTQVSVGIAFAGMIDTHHDWVINAPNIGWVDVDVRSIFSQTLSPYPWIIINDVTAAGIAEHHYGKHQRHSSLVLVMVGTGIGGAYLIDGKPVKGALYGAGEFGHLCFDSSPQAHLCRCGARGCLEAYVSGYAIENYVTSLQDNAITIDTIDNHGQNYPHISLQWEKNANTLGVAIANLVTILNPETLVLGGGVFDNMPVLRDMTMAVINAHTRNEAKTNFTLTKTTFDDDGGMLGSALYAMKTRKRHNRKNNNNGWLNL